MVRELALLRLMKQRHPAHFAKRNDAPHPMWVVDIKEAVRLALAGPIEAISSKKVQQVCKLASC